MGSRALYLELRALLIDAGVEVRTEVFRHPATRGGGICRTEGKRLVLLDAAASESEHARALLEIIETTGLDELRVTGSDLSAELLRTLNRRGRMAWPHKSQAPSVARAVPRSPSSGTSAEDDTREER